MGRVVCKFGLILMLFVAMPLASVAEKDQAALSNVADVNNTIISVAAADIVVAKERSTLSMSWIIKLFTPRDLEQKKIELTERLKKHCKADLIVDPQFSFEKNRLGGGKLIIYGYPAFYVNFRNLTPTEVDSLILHDKYKSGSAIFFDKSIL